jgi:uncharacterized protein
MPIRPQEQPRGLLFLPAEGARWYRGSTAPSHSAERRTAWFARAEPARYHSGRLAVTIPLVLLTLLVSAFAGSVGALLGVGGGAFLVPFLVLTGVPFRVAVGTSLVMIIATSTAVATGNTGRGLINFRLGMTLEVATAAGGLAGGLTAQMLSTSTLQTIFAVAASTIGVIMLLRLEQREPVLGEEADPGLLGARFHDEASGGVRTYRVRRVPAAVAASLVAGNISGLLGIGGGIVKVPVLTTWCGVPMRAAAATSSFMLGVTAVSSAVIYYAHGDVAPALAAAAVLGVQAGTPIGLRIGSRTDAKWLRLLMAAMLFVFAALMFVRAR